MICLFLTDAALIYLFWTSWKINLIFSKTYAGIYSPFEKYFLVPSWDSQPGARKLVPDSGLLSASLNQVHLSFKWIKTFQVQ